MKYFVEVNGKQHEVVLVEDPAGRAGTLAISIDDRPLDIESREIDLLGQLMVQCDGRSYGVSIEGDENDVTVTIAGHVYRVEIENERERAAHAADREAQKRGGVVKSVMPGVVVDILVEPGAQVAEGQPLLILEAMKMQNEIAAPSAARVEGIHVASGEAVNAGTKLVTLAAADG